VAVQHQLELTDLRHLPPLPHWTAAGNGGVIFVTLAARPDAKVEAPPIPFLAAWASA